MILQAEAVDLCEFCRHSFAYGFSFFAAEGALFINISIKNIPCISALKHSSSLADGFLRVGDPLMKQEMAKGNKCTPDRSFRPGGGSLQQGTAGFLTIV